MNIFSYQTKCSFTKYMLIYVFILQFLCLKNIGIFLQTCEQKFDLHKDDLFMPQMLFESSDFKKVSHYWSP